MNRINTSELMDLDPEALRPDLRKVVEQLADVEAGHLLPPDREQLIAAVLDEALGFGPLEPLLRDPAVAELRVFGPHRIQVNKPQLGEDRWEKLEVRFRDGAHLMQVLDRLLARSGQRGQSGAPLTTGRLPDGARFTVIVPPLAVDGPFLSYRRGRAAPLRLEYLFQIQSITKEMVILLEAAAKAGLNVMISGESGSGRTTLLNLLTGFIPDSAFILAVEETAELAAQEGHLLRLERRALRKAGGPEPTARELVRHALRMGVNRLLVGECDGPEVVDLLQAMNGGVSVMTTVRAHGPRAALQQLELFAAQAGGDLPAAVVRGQIAGGLNLIVQTRRLQGGPRRVTAITEVLGLAADAESHLAEYRLADVFRYQSLGLDGTGVEKGQFVATGHKPTFLPRLEAAGLKLPPKLFAERVLLKD
jgi:pilus assembly protein CpaF